MYGTTCNLHCKWYVHVPYMYKGHMFLLFSALEYIDPIYHRNVVIFSDPPYFVPSFVLLTNLWNCEVGSKNYVKMDPPGE